MKKIMYVFAISVLLVSCTTSKEHVAIDFRTPEHQKTDDNNLFFPDLNDLEWSKVKNYDTVDNTVYLLLNSIYTSLDQLEINYYVNIQTADGFNNVTAERMNCKNRTYQTIAFADLSNNSWIYQDYQQVKSIDSNINSLDITRKNLYERLCLGIFPKTKKNLKNKLL